MGDYILCPEETTCATACDGNLECVVYLGYDESPLAGCEDSCRTIIPVSEVEEVLSSPNFPEKYPEGLLCEYTLESNYSDYVISVNFTVFNVENDCDYDSVRLQDGYVTNSTNWIKYNKKTRFCGNLEGNDLPNVTSSSTSLVIFFNTDMMGNKQGWSLTYQAVPATANATGARRKRRSDPAPTADPPSDGSDSYDFNYGDGNFGDDYMNDMYDMFEDYGLLGPASFSKIEQYDWLKAFEIAKMPDYSDFKSFVKFKTKEIIGNGHQKEDFIVQCVFDGFVCSTDLFTTVQDQDLGNCFVFNSVVDVAQVTQAPKQPINTTKTGFASGLKLTFFLDKDEYIGILGQNSGARVSISNPKEFPPTNSKALFVSSGSNTIISMTQEKISRETYPYSDCQENWPEEMRVSDSAKRFMYTQDLCLVICQKTVIAEVCNCSETPDFEFSSDPEIVAKSVIYCDPWNDAAASCVSNIQEDFSENRRSCECPQPCEERVLNKVTSITEWPSDMYAPYFVSLLQRTKSRAVKTTNVSNLLKPLY